MTLLNELSAEVCQRARMSRDPRFDGRFLLRLKPQGFFAARFAQPTYRKKRMLSIFPRKR